MKRYANTIIETGIGTYEEMAEHPEGNWVKYEDVKKALALLNRAADCLQSYCANENGDMNDALAMEIETFLKEE